MSLSDDSLTEIFRALIDVGVNPSERLQNELATASGKTARIIREDYTILYKKRKGTDEDPFGPMSVIFGGSP